jgi:hypothetical protein
MCRFSAKSPVVNAMAREAALILAPLGRELSAIHIWSEENVMADALSREAAGARTPSALAAASRVCLAQRGPSTWQTLCGIHSQKLNKSGALCSEFACAQLPWCKDVRMFAMVQRLGLCMAHDNVVHGT